jgi:hypothetical protein
VPPVLQLAFQAIKDDLAVLENMCMVRSPAQKPNPIPPLPPAGEGQCGAER